jgi:small subunit ribosomal protein S1
VGRSSGPVRPRPTAAPPPPPPKKKREDRDAEKYAGTASEGGDEAQQRDQVDEEKPLVPKTDRGAPKGPRTAVPVPSKRGPLPDDLEAELAAALSDLSLEDVLKKEQGSRTGTELENDTRFQAPIVRIHNDDVFFSLDGRNEGVASLRIFRDPPQVGAQLEVIVTGYDAENGLYNVTVPGAAMSVTDWSDIQEGSVVEARVTAANTGGLECEVNKIRGFIPASQISMYRVENLAQFVGEKMLCVVTEANPQRKNLVLSRRAIMEREKEAAKAETLAGLNVGDIREGTVRSLRDFGAFVDLGGVDGMIHISKMSWDRIKHPSEVLQEGQKVKVKVDSIDPDTGKIGLSYRDDAEHPWNNIEARFPPGSTVRGTVSRIANYGAFVKLAPGIEGLLHISELAHHRVQRVQNHVQEGQEVEVKVLEVDKPSQRISLSLKATQAAPEPKEKKEGEPEVEEVRREPAVKPKRATLKGGTDRGNGGEQFGLKW